MPLLPLAAVGVLAAASRLSGGQGSMALVDEGDVDGNWGSQGAGVMLTTGQRVLLMYRSPHVYDPETWGVPGGAVPVDDMTGEPDDLISAAAREVREETGLAFSRSRLAENIVGQTVFRNRSFRFTTFIARVAPATKWDRIRLNWESDDSGWFSPEHLLTLDLHHGVRFTLREAWDTIFEPDAPGGDLRHRI
jgi:8-oxo-dGTP pyrophosphatase MutT (NUDIX family)